MKSALFIDLSTESPLHYENDFIKSMREHMADIETLDLDAGSDTMLFSYAGSMIQESERAALLIQAEKESETRKFYGLADLLVRNKSKALVMLKGKNLIMEKLLFALNDNLLQDMEVSDFIPHAVHFLKTKNFNKP